MTDPVTDVASFVRIITRRKSKSSYLTTYRGHPSAAFLLKPSIFRSKLARKNEHVLLRELIAAHPADFESDGSTLEQLVRMQHYSLPTRMLDVSWNPLVGLYFACQEFNPEDPAAASPSEYDGEVVMLESRRTRLKYFDSDQVSILSNLARLKWSLKMRLDTSVPMPAFNKSLAAKRLTHFIRQENYQFLPAIVPGQLDEIVLVRPKQNNRRISAQDGAFFLFGQRQELKDPNSDGISLNRITIPSRRKRRLLEELDKLAINQKTLFPELDRAALYLSQGMSTNMFLAKVLKMSGRP